MLDDPEVKTNSDAPKVNPLAPIGVMIGLFACVFRACIWARGNINAEAIGYAFGGILVALLIGYLFAGRKKVRSRNRFSAIFFGVCVFELLLEFSSKH